jgi:hypothetical protein
MVVKVRWIENRQFLGIAALRRTCVTGLGMVRRKCGVERREHRLVEQIDARRVAPGGAVDRCGEGDIGVRRADLVLC